MPQGLGASQTGTAVCDNIPLMDKPTADERWTPTDAELAAQCAAGSTERAPFGQRVARFVAIFPQTIIFFREDVLFYRLPQE